MNNRRQRTQNILDMARQFVQDWGRPVTLPEISHGIMREVWPMAKVEEVSAALAFLVACGEIRAEGDTFEMRG